MKSAFAINVEYGALRIACALVNAVPYPLAAAAARGLGWTAVRLFGYKRARTLGRIRSVFPDISDREAKRIAVRSLQNTLLTGIEMMRAPSLDRAWMDRHIVEGRLYKDRLQAYADEGRGVVVMVPHSGNWYMAAWSMARYGLKLFALAARQRNPKLDAWMNRQYGDVEVLDRDNRETLGEINDRLRAGRVFAILPDLRVRKPDTDAPFLGGVANVSHAGAMFAVHAGAPIVVAQMYREGGKHVFNHIATLRPDPAAPDPKEEARRLTREAMRLLDEAVRARPGDWYWYNKRWILEPVGPQAPRTEKSPPLRIKSSSGRGTILGAFALLVLLAALCVVAILKIEVTPIAEKKKNGPVRTREFAEGVRLSQKGLIGIDLVSIGRARMRKLRKGPFTIGAINELVLEDLAVALPEGVWNGGSVPVDAFVSNASNKESSVRSDAIGTIASTRGAGKNPASTERGTAAKRMLAALGINPGHIKMGEKIPRFSALAIRNLQVSRIVGGTNAVPWFAASSAKAERDGLALYSGWSVEGGVTNSWKEAFLAVEPKLMLYHP